VSTSTGVVGVDHHQTTNLPTETVAKYVVIVKST